MTSPAHFIETKNDYIYWHNTDGIISTEEATQLANEIKSLAESGNYTRLIVDNSKMNGVWSTEVDKIWVDLMAYVSQYIPKTATLCENIINKLQVNYLSSQSVNPSRMKAFTLTEKEEFENYINSNDKD
jgi:hypothetical protein